MKDSCFPLSPFTLFFFFNIKTCGMLYSKKNTNFRNSPFTLLFPATLISRNEELFQHKSRSLLCSERWSLLAREQLVGCLVYRCHILKKTQLDSLWKILKEMGIPDYLTCLLRNLCAGQEATVRTRHGTMDWFQIGTGVRQGGILSLCLFNSYAEYIMQNARLDEAQTGIKIARSDQSLSRVRLIATP